MATDGRTALQSCLQQTRSQCIPFFIGALETMIELGIVDNTSHHPRFASITVFNYKNTTRALSSTGPANATTDTITECRHTADLFYSVSTVEKCQGSSIRQNRFLTCTLHTVALQELPMTCYAASQSSTRTYFRLQNARLCYCARALQKISQT
jgi:hypothetical protein